ncbi:MarR family winged helix-turn-helix transcriptional regulator [Sphingosinicella sp. CPCC 101087]|uniref:MarR family winged helix-turn-helix transcriptional regulator n=1 Tax=Sphingosinicella sp. CPCC 101087 TaxID=2497754 RepID=UPI001FB18977|nr:MarR family transcriptional regulator [Sphingosinicella sp. CPCC 101087]
MIQSGAKPAVEPVDLSDVGEIKDILGFHIRLAYVAVYRHFMETFTDLDLTQKQVSVLWLVSDNPGIAQTDLAQRLHMDRATTMGIVNRLEARGYLRRGPSPPDRRRKTLYLTDEGDKMLLRARGCIWEHERWLKSRFTKKEVETLMSLLDRIHT